MDRIESALAAGRRPLTLAHLSMIDADPVMLVRAAVAGGFDGIGLRMLAPRGTALAGEIVNKPEVIAEVRKRLSDSGLGLWDAEFFSLRPDTKPKADYEAALDVVAELGGRTILTSIVDPDRARAIDGFCQLCEIAAPLGLTVGLEYISFRDLRTLDEALALIEAAGQANGGVIADLLHHSRVGGTAAELAAVPPARYAYAQICDAGSEIPGDAEALMIEARTGRLLPGEGALPLADWLAALPSTLAIGLEAPVAALASLKPIERAKIMGERTRAFLEAAEIPRYEGKTE